jgi:hypothetical protein
MTGRVFFYIYSDAIKLIGRYNTIDPYSLLDEKNNQIKNL